MELWTHVSAGIIGMLGGIYIGLALANFAHQGRRK